MVGILPTAFIHPIPIRRSSVRLFLSTIGASLHDLNSIFDYSRDYG